MLPSQAVGCHTDGNTIAKKISQTLAAAKQIDAAAIELWPKYENGNAFDFCILNTWVY